MKHMHRLQPGVALLVALLAACATTAVKPKVAADIQQMDTAKSDATGTCATDGALSTCLTPKQLPAYYADQGNKYFDALDRSSPAASVPTYADLVARWEWPPWLSAATVNHPPRAEFGHRDGAGIRPRTRYHPLA